MASIVRSMSRRGRSGGCTVAAATAVVTTLLWLDNLFVPPDAVRKRKANKKTLLKQEKKYHGRQPVKYLHYIKMRHPPYLPLPPHPGGAPRRHIAGTAAARQEIGLDFKSLYKIEKCLVTVELLIYLLQFDKEGIISLTLTPPLLASLARLVRSDEYPEKCKRSKLKVAGLVQSGSKWTKPNQEWMKLNIDGSFADRDKRVGIGMILRDSSGMPIFTACQSIHQSSYALEFEILAFKKGITKVLQWTLFFLVVESDCVMVVSLMTSREFDRSQVAFIIQEARCILDGDRKIVLRKINRSQNKVSHELTNYARTQDIFMF
uniref:RNase H type-1 domain-containing protein n=1 Tax=Oryza brachyantha TaxID=4533 RepID=J3ND45_ORYBR